jgi:hypothetical protein
MRQMEPSQIQRHVPFEVSGRHRIGELREINTTEALQDLSWGQEKN